MNVEYVRAPIVRLRNLGLDERWVQDRIAEDPSLLGLGDLMLIERERIQMSGGRLDLLLADAENSIRYEVEVMLGALDERHIIRSIEYWDVERRRFPSLQHRAVIIAEDITNRFFNIISLLNKSVPMIALQMGAVCFDQNKVALNFTKVLDISETFDDIEEEEEEAEKADRTFWERRVPPEALAIADATIAWAQTEFQQLRIAYTRGYIALGTTGRNFIWLKPLKRKGRCWCSYFVGTGDHSQIEQDLNECELIEFQRKGKRIKLAHYAENMERHKDVLLELLHAAEEASRS